MIISHKHKYVFVCLPRTGTTAIRNELIDLYDGEPIHYKHATYDYFIRHASPEERKYRVICTVRNPLDRTVSLYYKYKSNHDGINVGQIKEIGRKNILQRTLISFANRILGNRSKFVSNGGATFQDFFKKYFRQPYSDWHFLNYHKYDFIIRFENMQEDFKSALTFLGIIPIRPLPVINKTEKSDSDFESHYTSEIQHQAVYAFYYVMVKYNYAFPKHWKISAPGYINSTYFILLNRLRFTYWKYIR